MRNHLFTASLALLLGCSGITEPERGPANDRGVLIARYPDVSDLTWSADGSEVYFIEGYVRIRAALANGSGVRTLYSSTTSLGHISAAANKLYLSVYAGNTPPRYQILRIDPSGTSAANVETALVYGGGQVRSHRFAISADARFLAFGDSLFDLTTATRRALPKGEAWSFSPDGSQLLYQLEGTGAPGPMVLIATADLGSVTLNTPTDVARNSYVSVGEHYWNGNDPKFLRVTTNESLKQLKAFVFDGRSAADREIASITTDFGLLNKQGAISPDGSRAVVWLGPFLDWSELHMIQTESLARSVVAAVNARSSIVVDNVVLSQDGSRAAYIVYEDMTFGSSGTTSIYVASAAGTT
jgi:hypothetical protein